MQKPQRNHRVRSQHEPNISECGGIMHGSQTQKSDQQESLAPYMKEQVIVPDPAYGATEPVPPVPPPQEPMEELSFSPPPELLEELPSPKPQSHPLQV
ncbi:hypothetical protein DPEC_G00155000 [Dallia pectoralis]|uniref:Uncharacterized protein n=1 Tax=Dallia pectoralis TaxID=75939 RepID=A0ACC2GKU2_DALPE|nr:hypothetical protein DPEC_G00155000 [Dallia pectoralis]